MAFLPFWNSELYIEISPFFPLGRDYHTVSVNRFYDNTLKNVAELCLDLEGEFLFMASPSTGCVGNLPRENFFKFKPDNVFNLGFLVVFGYSELLEKAVILSLTAKASKGLTAGLASCSLWSKGRLQARTRAIAVASDDPFYDGSEYLSVFEDFSRHIKDILKVSDLSYYAEKFGYDRFFVPYESVKPYDINISQTISDFKNENVKEIAGGTTSINFPPFMGISVSVNMK